MCQAWHQHKKCITGRVTDFGCLLLFLAVWKVKGNTGTNRSRHKHKLHHVPVSSRETQTAHTIWQHLLLLVTFSFNNEFKCVTGRTQGSRLVILGCKTITNTLVKCNSRGEITTLQQPAWQLPTPDDADAGNQHPACVSGYNQRHSSQSSSFVSPANEAELIKGKTTLKKCDAMHTTRLNWAKLWISTHPLAAEHTHTHRLVSNTDTLEHTAYISL